MGPAHRSGAGTETSVSGAPSAARGPLVPVPPHDPPQPG